MWLSQFKSKKGQALAVPLLYWIFVVTCDGISADDEQIVQIDRLAPATYHTRTNFLSITLDSSTIGNGFNVFNMTDTKLIKMMGHLSPGFLRVGGTLGDRLYFSPDSVEVDKNVDLQIATNFTMTGAQWLQLTDLAKQANLDVIFQLNALMRLSDGSWDYSNAETLISFSDEHKLNLDWELGNEPDIFHQQFNEEVNTTQLAKDFATLRSILDKYETYKESQLFGPDTTWPSEGNKYYIRDFVKDASHVIDAVTWHHYYMNGHTAKAEDFLNPKIFDDLSAHIKIVKDAAKEVNASSVPIWLGETSSAYGGGAPNLSDIFIASFLWVDKLGVSAKMGLELVARQSIVDYNYALLDKSYNPNPDWWVSVLYKKLVGTKVVPYNATLSSTVRLYCHCANVDDSSAASVTVFGVNLDNSTVNVRIDGLFEDEDSVETIYAYELTSDSLHSKTVYLNEEPLNLTEDYDLPELLPKYVSTGSPVTMPPYSIVFWVIPTTDVSACL